MCLWSELEEDTEPKSHRAKSSTLHLTSIPTINTKDYCGGVSSMWGGLRVRGVAGAQLTSWLMRPRPEWSARIRAIKNAIGFSHPIIGLHIRHGDACTHGHLSNYRPPCLGVAEYVVVLREMQNKYGVRNVFVATDDTEVLQELRDKHSSEFHFVHVSFDRTVFDAKWFIEYRMAQGAVDARLVAETSLIDILLLRLTLSLSSYLPQLTSLVTGSVIISSEPSSPILVDWRSN